MDLNLPSVDIALEEDGAWIDFTENVSFCIARIGSPEYKTALRKEYNRNKRFIDNGTMSDEQSDKVLIGLQAKYILKGWKGLKNGKDKFPYSEENAVSLLSDPSYAEIRAWILEQSNSIENYRAEETKK